MDAGSVDSRHVTHIQNIYLDIGIAAHEHSLETVHHAEEERSGYGINENPFRQIVLIDKTFVKITHDFVFFQRFNGTHHAHTAHKEQGSQKNPDIHGNGQIDKNGQQKRQKHDGPVGFGTPQNIFDCIDFKHAIGSDDHDGGKAGKGDCGSEGRKPKHKGEHSKAMDDGGNGASRTAADIGCGSCDSAGCGNAAEQRTRDIAGTLRDKFHIGIVPVPCHAVCDNAGKQ